MISIATSPYHLTMQRKLNTWYSVKDGNWDDPSVWRGNGTKKYSLPQIGDDVHVDHVVTVNININVRNIYISCVLKTPTIYAVALSIFGNCQVSGSGLIDLSANFHQLNLYGNFNIIPSGCFAAGSFSTVNYVSSVPQPIINIPYRNLSTSGGIKYQVDDVITLGNFNQQSNYEIGPFNLTITGSSILGTVGSYYFTKNSNVGNIIFIGNVEIEGIVDLTIGNPSIEFRGGLQIHTTFFSTGTGNVTFTTNNQIINSSAYLSGIWNSPIIISGPIAVNILGIFTTHNTINGTVSGSTLNNSGTLNLYNSTTPMLTGVFNYMYDANSILGLFYDGNYTLPYTNYAGLTVGGVGIKSQGANTTVNKSLIIDPNSSGNIYQCNGFNLNVKGAFTNWGGFKANAYCNVIFEGFAQFINGLDGSLGVDLSIGNPDIEFRNGLKINAYSTFTGNGIFNFTTNNQQIDFSINNSGVINCNILISGAIIVTYIDGSNNITNYINGIINGDNSSSTFINKGILCYGNSQSPMQTGVLNLSGFANTFIYTKSGSQDIASGIYKNLVLQNSGAKKLTGNVSVLNSYVITSPTTLDINGYTLSNP